MSNLIVNPLLIKMVTRRALGVQMNRQSTGGGDPGPGGVSDYNELVNRPELNGVTIEGDHDGYYYGLYNDRRLKTYTSLSQIGLTGSQTLAQIYSALPIGSIIYLNRSDLAAESLPPGNTTIDCIITIEKTTGSVDRAIWDEGEGLGERWSNFRAFGQWWGWKKVEGVKFYSKRSELGLTGTVGTLQNLVDALPVGDTVYYGSEADINSESRPTASSTGTLIIVKERQSRKGYIEFRSTNPEDGIYVMMFQTTGSYLVSGTWTKIYPQLIPSTYRTAAEQDVIDAGKADKITEVTISTAGAVTQELNAGEIYHFTGALTALTVTATDPTVGTYQFDFISGATVPTLTVPASWVMPDNFLVEPSARYSLSIQNGYCSLKKWSDSHSPFIYLDSTAGDFVMNSSGISEGKVYANVGTEVEVINIDVKLKNQLSNNTWLKICDISASSKALMGSTYVSSHIAVGGGKITLCVFNTWETSSEIKVKNNTGAALAANTQITGAIFILRTL